MSLRKKIAKLNKRLRSLFAPRERAEETQFERDIAAFVAAGNLIKGRPTSVSPKSRLIFSGGGSSVEFGERCSFDGKIRFHDAGGRIVVGRDSRVRGQLRVSGPSSIMIGERTNFARRCKLIAYEGAKIQIGKKCLISNVLFRTCDMHTIFDASTGERINPSRSIHIHDRVWIAENVTVLKGVTIGKNAIIASNSIVTKPVPEGVLAAGAPARVVREGIKWAWKLHRMPALPPLDSKLEMKTVRSVESKAR